jgi:hypothetical protein
MRWLLLLVSCYSPGISDGQFTCETSSVCPSGFECICRVCRPTGSTCSDMSVPDLAAVDSAAGDFAVADLAAPPDLKTTMNACAAGMRSPQDPGKDNVALCPAAWTVGGINPNPATPCNRMAGPNGMSGATACSIEDNCAPGWHVCLDEADVMKGLNRTDCSNLDNVGSLWVTRQAGGPPPSPGPPACGNGMSLSVFGCGSLTQVGNAPTCSLFTRVLLNPPDTTDQCSTSTGGVFICGTSDVEAHTLQKPLRAGGGVICCKD